MSLAYSIDLRDRVVGAMMSSSSARAAAARFGVSIAAATLWAQCALLRAKVGGHCKSILSPEKEWMLEQIAAALR